MLKMEKKVSSVKKFAERAKKTDDQDDVEKFEHDLINELRNLQSQNLQVLMEFDKKESDKMKHDC